MEWEHGHVNYVQHIHVLYVLCHLFGAWSRRILSVGRGWRDQISAAGPAVFSKRFDQNIFPDTIYYLARACNKLLCHIFLGGAINCKLYERPALESVIGRRRALYNKRYQGDLQRLEKSDMKNLMALVFASTILFSNYGPTLSIDWIFCYQCD